MTKDNLIFENARKLFMQGLESLSLCDFKSAESSFLKSLDLMPDRASTLINLAAVQLKLEKYEDALKSASRSLTIDPHNAEAYINIGIALKELNQYEAALQSVRRAIEVDPGYAQAHNTMGIVLQDLNLHKDAASNFQRSIEINSNYAEAFNNLGNSFLKLNLYESAIKNIERAIEINPEFSQAYVNLGLVFLDIGRYADAIDNFKKAISLNKYLEDAYYNMSLILLYQENFDLGWELYDWRLKVKKYRLKIWNSGKFWNGEKSENKLLVIGEQGLGDQILHAGLLPELSDYPQDKVLALERRLLPLFKRSMPEMDFVDIEQLSDSGGFEEQIAIGSLARLFRPDRESFKRVKSPYLVADSARVQALLKIVRRTGKRVCGVSWSSKREDIGQGKSIDLAQMLLPLVGAGLHFVNLQYGDTEKEREALKSEHGMELQNVDEVDNFADIDGLAALIQACDLVITISNTTVHLAGALGKDTLLLVPRGRSRLWYWGQDQRSSNWYPTVRIYGQEKIGDWQGPMAQIKADLESKSWN